MGLQILLNVFWPWNRHLHFMFPLTYVVSKVVRISHWLSIHLSRRKQTTRHKTGWQTIILFSPLFKVNKVTLKQKGRAHIAWEAKLCGDSTFVIWPTSIVKEWINSTQTNDNSISRTDTYLVIWKHLPSCQIFPTCLCMALLPSNNPFIVV